MSTSLDRPAAPRIAMARNAAIVGVTGLAMMAIRLVSLMAFARMMPPEAFGLAAIPISLTLALGILVDLGLSVALVQARYASRTLSSSIFWMQIALATLFAITVFATAPFIAGAMDVPEAAPLIQGVTIVFVANAVGGVPAALLQRAGRFGTLSIGEFAGGAIGFALAMALALRGGEEWALLAFFVAQHIARAVFFLAAARFRPRRRVSRRALAVILRFGSRLAAASAFEVLSGHGDRLIAVRFLSVAVLGLYHQAQNLVMIPFALIVWTTQTVLLAALAPLQRDRAAFTEDALAASRVIVALTAACYAGVAALAEPLTTLVLGADPAWEGVAPLLFILSVGWFISAAAAPLHAIYQAAGRGDVILRISVVGCIATLTLVGAGAAFGPEGAAAGLACATVARTVLSIALLDPTYGPARGVWLRALAPSFLSAAIMYGLVALGHAHLAGAGVAPLPALALLVPGGAAVFGLALGLLDPTVRRFALTHLGAVTRGRS